MMEALHGDRRPAADQHPRASRLYRTPAWGRTDQPDFINAVVELRTRLAARVLLDYLLEIETRFGRVRREDDRWGPRTLDLDLLLFGEEVLDVPGLHVPHPRLHERAFVLVPLAEIAATLRDSRAGARSATCWPRWTRPDIEAID